MLPPDTTPNDEDIEEAVRVEESQTYLEMLKELFTNPRKRALVIQTLSLLGQGSILLENAISQIYDEKSAYRWFEPLTHWKLLLIFLNECLMTLQMLGAFKNNDLHNNIHISTVRDLAMTTAFAVDGLEWTCNIPSSLGDVPYAALTHGINTFAFVGKTAYFGQDYVPELCSRRYWTPVAFALTYLASNYLIVTQFGEPNTYPVLDWTKKFNEALEYAGIGLFAFMAIPVLIYLLRSCCRTNKPEDLDSHTEYKFYESYASTPSDLLPSQPGSPSESGTDVLDELDESNPPNLVSVSFSRTKKDQTPTQQPKKTFTDKAIAYLMPHWRRAPEPTLTHQAEPFIPRSPNSLVRGRTSE